MFISWPWGLQWTDSLERALFSCSNRRNLCPELLIHNYPYKLIPEGLFICLWFYSWFSPGQGWVWLLWKVKPLSPLQWDVHTQPSVAFPLCWGCSGLVFQLGKLQLGGGIPRKVLLSSHISQPGFNFVFPSQNPAFTNCSPKNPFPMLRGGWKGGEKELDIVV